MDWQAVYDTASARHSAACGDVSTYKGKVEEYEDSKTESENLINQYTATIKTNEDASEILSDMLTYEEATKCQYDRIEELTDDISTEYKDMVYSTGVENGSWSVEFSEEMSWASGKIDDAFEHLRQSKASVDQTIADNKEWKKKEKETLSCIKKQLKSARSSLSNAERERDKQWGIMEDAKKHL